MKNDNSHHSRSLKAHDCFPKKGFEARLQSGKKVDWRVFVEHQKPLCTVAIDLI